jgi:hypothetical protein
MGFHGRDQRSKIELRRSTATHILDGISWQRSEIKNRADKKHSHSQTGLDFMTEGQRSKTELRKSTATHILDGISWQEIRDQKQS